MMRVWRYGRDPFGPDYSNLSESDSATYRFESALGTCAQFTGTIDAQWTPSGNGGRRLVFNYLYSKATEVTRQYSVLDAALANEALTDTFDHLRGLDFPSSGVRLQGASAELRVDEGDQRYATKKAVIQKEKLLLAEVRDTFLCDSATAGLWWANGDHDRVLELGAHRDEFAAAVNLVNGTADSQAEADNTGELISEFLRDLGPEHRNYLLGQLGKFFSSWGRDDLAERLRPAD